MSMKRKRLESLDKGRKTITLYYLLQQHSEKNPSINLQNFYMCEGWYFTCRCKKIASPHHFTNTNGRPGLFLLKCCTKTGNSVSCIFVLGVSILPPFLRFFFYCGTIPTVWYFFVFHFILFFKGRNDIILHTGSQPFCSFVLLIRLHDLR